MTQCFREADKSLGYDLLKPEPERVLSEFMLGKDVFVAIWKTSLLRCTTSHFRSEEVRVNRLQAVNSNSGLNL